MMSRSLNSRIAHNEFSECALVEIIHLHDCLRGALNELQNEVESLVKISPCIDGPEEDHGPKHVSEKTSSSCNIQDDGNKGSFSVSSSSSSSGDKSNLDKHKKEFEIDIASDLAGKVASRFHLIWSVFRAHSGAEDEFIWPALKVKVAKLRRPTEETDVAQNGSNSDEFSSPTIPVCSCSGTVIGQEEYEEDHANEEIMFEQINSTLRRLKGSFRYYHVPKNQTDQSRGEALFIIRQVILLLKKQMDNLVIHLKEHLKKEEEECLPIVKKHLSNEEISTLVGNIMGKRSAEVMTNILNLAVCNLPAEERADMVAHMKNAMVGTFFEKWLKMGGWEGGQANENGNVKSLSIASSMRNLKRKLPEELGRDENTPRVKKMISERDSRLRYPSRWYRKDADGNISLLWCSSNPKLTSQDILPIIPRFTQVELTPTYHFSSSQGGPVLGCEHYARACKLRHPITGMLFPCRICCEEQREAAKNNISAYHQQVEPLPMLDRYAVREVLCMRCGSLQPAGRSCVNPDCTSNKPYARYSCTICWLFDDAPSKDIYHCPFCNACRKGRGLGIDFRHCMRCNACISVDQYEAHKCIPQRLQGNCPICQVELFDSTEPLRGMKCGHVMHLSCFNRYMASCDNSRRKITCPQCKTIDSFSG